MTQSSNIGYAKGNAADGACDSTANTGRRGVTALPHVKSSLEDLLYCLYEDSCY